jgi:hypothetical protein
MKLGCYWQSSFFINVTIECVNWSIIRGISTKIQQKSHLTYLHSYLFSSTPLSLSYLYPVASFWSEVKLDNSAESLCSLWHSFKPQVVTCIELLVGSTTQYTNTQTKPDNLRCVITTACKKKKPFQILPFPFNFYFMFFLHYCALKDVRVSP